ncbi:MAG: hypothetical protein WAW39_16645 [Prosthecobacter sp.]|uniref:hypothetical protein n=1 Tax=Prosthecobacter sp. TaxID=1965333 RepID=UPI003BAF13BA
MNPRHSELSLKSGLYDPVLEHDACGVGFVLMLGSKRSYTMLELPELALAVEMRAKQNENGTHRTRAATLQCSPHDRHINPELHENLIHHAGCCSLQYGLIRLVTSNLASRYECLNTLAGGTVAVSSPSNVTRHFTTGCSSGRTMCRRLHKMLC